MEDRPENHVFKWRPTDFKHNKPCNYSTRLVFTILSSFFAYLSLIYFFAEFFLYVLSKIKWLLLLTGAPP